MIIIQVGNEKSPGNDDWVGYIEGYFESEKHAEKYLVEQGYEKDFDNIFFKENDIARITEFKKIEVNM